MKWSYIVKKTGADFLHNYVSDWRSQTVQVIGVKSGSTSCWIWGVLCFSEECIKSCENSLFLMTVLLIWSQEVVRFLIHEEVLLHVYSPSSLNPPWLLLFSQQSSVPVRGWSVTFCYFFTHHISIAVDGSQSKPHKQLGNSHAVSQKQCFMHAVCVCRYVFAFWDWHTEKGSQGVLRFGNVCCTAICLIT